MEERGDTTIDIRKQMKKDLTQFIRSLKGKHHEVALSSERRVSLVGDSCLPALNGRWFKYLRVCCYRTVSLRERIELQPLDKSAERVELSSVDILLVEGISVLKKYSISVSLLLSHKKRGRKINITVLLFITSSNHQM